MTWARSRSTRSGRPAGKSDHPDAEDPAPLSRGGRSPCRLTCGPGWAAWSCRTRCSPRRAARAPGRELAQFIDVARVGAIITKSIMAEPRTGNPAPRLAETPSGLLNSVGLQGPGIDAFLQRDLPWLLSHGARVVVSIAGQTVREYGDLAARLSDAAGVCAVEVNLSCPNAEDAGRVFALDPRPPAGVVAAVRGAQARHAGVRQVVAGRDRHRGGGRYLRRGRRGRALADQRADRHGHRSRDDAARAGRGVRRAVRPRRPAGSGAVRMAGPRGLSRCADHRDGRRAHRRGTRWSCCSPAPP